LALSVPLAIIVLRDNFLGTPLHAAPPLDPTLAPRTDNAALSIVSTSGREPFFGAWQIGPRAPSFVLGHGADRHGAPAVRRRVTDDPLTSLTTYSLDMGCLSATCALCPTMGRRLWGLGDPKVGRRPMPGLRGFGLRQSLGSRILARRQRRRRSLYYTDDAARPRHSPCHERKIAIRANWLRSVSIGEDDLEASPRGSSP
jgi:hypothetical protein